MNFPSSKCKHAAMWAIAACLIAGLFLSIYLVPSLVAGVRFELSDNWLIALVLFPLIAFVFSLLSQWLSELDRLPVEPLQISTRHLLIGGFGLMAFTISALIIAALAFDNLMALFNLVYGVLGLTLICTVIAPVVWLPFILMWVFKFWLNLFRPLIRPGIGRSSPSTDESDASSA